MAGAVIRLVAVVLARLPRLAWTSTSIAYQLWRGRRRAARSFYLTMRRGGVPEDLALELSRCYPRLDPAEIMALRDGGNRTRRHRGA